MRVMCLRGRIWLDDQPTFPVCQSFCDWFAARWPEGGKHAEVWESIDRPEWLRYATVGHSESYLKMADAFRLSGRALRPSEVPSTSRPMCDALRKLVDADEMAEAIAEKYRKLAARGHQPGG